jgi:hypothetical protein
MKSVIKRNATVHSTEEYRELVEQVKTQGGHVTFTHSLPNGISVQYEVPK